MPYFSLKGLGLFISDQWLLFQFLLLTYLLGGVYAQPAHLDDTKTNLRILPLGDSITEGFRDPTGNGYRFRLQKDLSTNKLDFVGTQRSG